MSVFNDLLEPEFQEHATALGALCRWWAELENSVRLLLVTTIAGEPDGANWAIAHKLEFKDCLQSIKLAAVAKLPPGRVQDATISFVNYVHDQLRNERNRCVHDGWEFDLPGMGVMRVDRSPKIQREQARQPQTLRPITLAAVTSDELWDLVRRVRDCSRRATFLVVLWQNPQNDGLLTLLEEPPGQRRPRPQSEKRGRQGTTIRGRARLPRSSPE